MRGLNAVPRSLECFGGGGLVDAGTCRPDPRFQNAGLTPPGMWRLLQNGNNSAQGAVPFGGSLCQRKPLQPEVTLLS